MQENVFTRFFRGFTLITTILILIYLIICYVSFIAFPPKYGFLNDNFFGLQTTILTQPIMDVFASQKASRWYNWQQIPTNEVSTNIPPVSIFSDKVKREPQNNYYWPNVTAVFDRNGEVAILEPIIGNEQNWQVVWCNDDITFCQASDIYFKGKIRLLASGKMKVWGKTLKGEYFQLRLLKYQNVFEPSTVMYL